MCINWYRGSPCFLIGSINFSLNHLNRLYLCFLFIFYSLSPNLDEGRVADLYSCWIDFVRKVFLLNFNVVKLISKNMFNKGSRQIILLFPLLPAPPPPAPLNLPPPFGAATKSKKYRFLPSKRKHNLMNWEN